MKISNNRPLLGAQPKSAPKAEAAPQAAAAASGPAESASFGSVPARILNVAPSAVAAAESKYEGVEVEPGELIVKMNGSIENNLMGDFAGEYGAKVIEKFDLGGGIYKSFGGDMMRLKLPAGISPFEAMAAMKGDERVSFAEPNEVIYLDELSHDEGQQQAPPQGQQPPVDNGEPNDLHEKLWGLKNTGQTGGTAGADTSAVGAWAVTKGDGSDNGPLIAVIDTGIDYNHPDLVNNMWTNPGEIPGDGIDNDENGVIDDVHGYYPGGNSGDPMDGHSHGTHCSGTIAAEGNNGEGVTGVMQNARLMGVKIFSDSGRTTAADIVKGINYANRMGADITSNSWGGGGRSEAIYEAFKANDALHVIAAGNSNYDNDKRDNFPSNYDLDNIVAVAATNHNDQRASFSQWGASSVDVSAPGRNIYSTVPISKGSYGNKSGTSMATPHVSGGAGLIMSAYPDASNAEVKARLIHGSDKIAALNDISVSDGRVNFAASVEDDSVAPGAPNDFGASNVSTRGADLSWTSVGDDKWANGAAQGVELLVSDKPLDAEDANIQTIGLGGAPEVGDLASYSYDVLPSESERTVHFGMQSVDNAANRSELRTATVTIPAADAALKDDFDGQSVSFGATGDFAAVDVEGRGKVFSSASDSSTGASALTSPTVDLTGKTGAYLKFDSATSLWWGQSAKVEVSSDAGESWNTVSTMERRSEWGSTGLDLSDYDGQSVQLRFNVKTSEGRNTGGLQVDNVVLLTDKA
jgi:subtilisin family serine protease